MLRKIAVLVFLLMGTISIVNGQTSTKGDARAILVELGDSLRNITDSTQQCQALLKQIKAWQQKKLSELEPPDTPRCRSLVGKIGSSLEWGGSGWLDLDTPTDFVKGDRFRVKIVGTAAKILIRLLPKGIPPGLPQEIIGSAITVPESRIVEVSLDTDFKGIIQISVHGGPNPWGMYPLGANNGPAALAAAELCRYNK